MRLFLWLMGLTAAVCAGGALVWVVLAEGQKQGLERWLELRRSEGWLAEVTAVDISGFPTRFDRRLEAPSLADPRAGWAWDAPFLEMGSDAWDPTHVTFVFPTEHSLALPGARIAITSEEMGAIAAVVPDLSLALREVGFTTEALRLEGREGWRAAAEAVTITVARRSEEAAPPNTYDVTLDATGVLLPDRLVEDIAPAGAGGQAGLLTLAGLVTTDRPIDRTVIERGEIGAEAILLRAGTLSYAGIDLRLKGRLTADANGFAAGTLDLVAEDWRRLLSSLVASGAVSGGMESTVRRAMELISMFSGGDRLEVPISFGGGDIRVGPVVIGKAPRLRRP